MTLSAAAPALFLKRCSTLQLRCFSASALGRADLIQSLYVQHLKAYKPLPKASIKTELPETFTLPKAPAAPVFDKTELTFESSALAKDADWPPLENPIDHPDNFNGAFFFFFYKYFLYFSIIYIYIYIKRNKN